jgi:hypothetical protein
VWWPKSKEKKPPSATMSRGHAEALKRFYVLKDDRQLAALYKNRHGFEIKINEETKKEKGK